MFGRRRHAAPVAVAPTPQLSDERIFELVHARLAAAIGEHGAWSLSRRTGSDTDDIFHGVLAHSIALSITDALRDARIDLESNDISATAESTPEAHVPEHAAEPQPDAIGAGSHEVVAESEAVETEPAAFRWDPAPITIWTDLKKPVTGELARADRHELVA